MQNGQRDMVMKLSEINMEKLHGDEPGESPCPAESCEDWLMTDQQRREVTANARRCIKSSWEECDDAI